MSGETPDNICPVIIPGNDTKPTASNILVIGISAALSATFLASSKGTPNFISASKRSPAKLILFMQFAKIIPAMGITVLGAYHGLSVSTPCVVNMRTVTPPNNEAYTALKYSVFRGIAISLSAIQLAVASIKLSNVITMYALLTSKI